MAREIHGRQICAYLFLSSPQREIQVKREELLEYAQSIISGLKRNDEIVKLLDLAALRRAPPGAVRQPHQPFERLTQTCFDKSQAAILPFRTTT
ncbi:hypothetical protein Zm00014a_026594 [Zea mays]|uniref:Uncharacterized protein n=1 Tax=Zea mays TaxID=4577 RepID=A0A3L6DYX8_MAIZE|nr:hypothetical protein Zm00014a_026594 [Zea mays]